MDRELVGFMVVLGSSVVALLVMMWVAVSASIVVGIIALDVGYVMITTERVHLELGGETLLILDIEVASADECRAS